MRSLDKTESKKKRKKKEVRVKRRTEVDINKSLSPSVRLRVGELSELEENATASKQGKAQARQASWRCRPARGRWRIATAEEVGGAYGSVDKGGPTSLGHG